MTGPAAGAAGYAELRAGGARCRIRHAPGAPVTDIAFRDEAWGAPGGLVDRFPTVGACTIPTWVRGVGGTPLRAGGEVAAAVPLTTVHVEHEVPAAVSEWVVAAVPVLFTRAVRCTRDGGVACTYTVENVGTVRVPFVWWGALALPLDAGTTIEVAASAGRVAWAAEGSGVAAGASFRWPTLPTGGSALDLHRPAAAGMPDFALKAILTVDAATAVIRRAGAGLRLRWDAPGAGLGVWINQRGWWPGTPAPRRLLRRAPRPPRHLAVGPMLGAPDRLDDALGGWGGARWVEPGERVSWSVRWEADATDGTR